nr:ABC transporter permease [Candidatus Endomicrobium trichonymphae]
MALTAVANIIGICGGMILTTSLWEVSSSSYWSEVLDFMRVSTFFHGFIKSVFSL